ncbi:transmembrane protein, putative (macronuclear) [Tetrahymena thermophila SB210]|uniref:Transmembrane protein, putative n=1 Tax=Tetrahymena thermophila (strain SB210) TaxID=312017 RepID=Q22BX0_TETTS|nr:transmembrane protein, putative [Tetrahymena thermophila SB210]EAR82788.2 transmembrane protein, putative [Tetrahymena thermophila SB210]|eukprot:XP_001030451.2 transmembrane protein, putative [Tetrahymena thermophila SB210]
MLRDSLVSSTSSADEEKMLQDLQRKQQMKIIQNNFTLLIILNIINFLLFLFSFSFYMWYNLQMELTESSSNGEKGQKTQQRVWLNMLYVFDEQGQDGQHYLTFQTYKDSDIFICKKFTDQQDFCENKISQMQLIGYISFGALFIGVILQCVDLYRLIKLRASHGNRSGIKAFWLHPTIIIFYISGFSLYFIVVLYNQIANSEMSFNLGSFGASFWIGIASIPIYIVLTIYYRKTKNKLKSSELVNNLIQKIDVFEQTQKEKKKMNINSNTANQSMSSNQKPEPPF